MLDGEHQILVVKIARNKSVFPMILLPCDNIHSESENKAKHTYNRPDKAENIGLLSKKIVVDQNDFMIKSLVNLHNDCIHSKIPRT